MSSSGPGCKELFVFMRILYFVMSFLLLFAAVNCYFIRGELCCGYQPSYDSYSCQLKEKWLIGGISRSCSGSHAAIAEAEFKKMEGRRRTKQEPAIAYESGKAAKSFLVNFVTLDNETADDILLNRYFYNKHDFLQKNRSKKFRQPCPIA